MKLETIEKPPETEESTKTSPSQEERSLQMEIVDKYLMGEPIEREIQISKLKIVLRAPSIAILNDIYREIARAAKESYMDMQVESSSSLIAAYVRNFNGKDFLKEYGDEFNTEAGKQKIREYLDSVLIEPVRDMLSEKVFQFYNDIKQAFSDESLDFS